MMISSFNIRVYGLLIREDSILVCDEEVGEMAFTKFPGGGLELGEGLSDALKREIMEELGISISGHTHFYTTDFFLRSAFNPSEQLISVYYKITSDEEIAQYDVTEYRDGQPYRMQFRWIRLADFSEEDITFPVDRHVARMLTGSV